MMEKVQTTSTSQLWNKVIDMLDYWGEEDQRLSECTLIEGATKNSYILQAPKELIELVEEKLDAIEDALEQLLWEHQVDVYVVVREESMKKSRESIGCRECQTKQI
jgi:hypothetical protein